MATKNGPGLSSWPVLNPVELPGIEPVVEIALDLW